MSHKSCKTILIGESGVGKTCILSRFINGKFDNNSSSTTGGHYICKNLYFEEYDKNIFFELWDTAGQEKYRGLTKIFYKGAKIIILVYDTTNKKSFNEIKNYWYKQITENCTEQISKIIFSYNYFIFKYLELLGINVIYSKKNKFLKKKQRNLPKK